MMCSLSPSGEDRHMRHFGRPRGAPPVHGYSQAESYAADATMVWVSGQVPVDSDGQVIGIGDPEAQMRQGFHNIGVALAAAGSDLPRVVKFNVCRTDGPAGSREKLREPAGSGEVALWAHHPLVLVTES